MSLPQIGQLAPAFKSKAVLNDKVFDASLSDYVNKYLVLLFYPMDFTFVCPTELIAFSDSVHEFREINTTVLGCSVDSYLSHLKWLSMAHKDGGIRGLRFPLMADKSMAITKQYGVLDEEQGIAYRAMFIIDDIGIVRQITINDHPVGRSVPETYRLIKAIQHATKLRESASVTDFVEVCQSSIEKPRLCLSTEKNLICELTE